MDVKMMKFRNLHLMLFLAARIVLLNGGEGYVARDYKWAGGRSQSKIPSK